MELARGNAEDGGLIRHPVADAPPARAGASAAAVLAGIGHAGTFLALGAGSLWLALKGADALPIVQKVFVGGLYLQLLPTVGFGLVARHLARFGRPSAAAAAGALSLVSILLMAVGTRQPIGAGGVQTAFLAAALVVVTALGLGMLTSGLAHAVKHRFESEPLIVLDPEAWDAPAAGAIPTRAGRPGRSGATAYRP